MQWWRIEYWVKDKLRDIRGWLKQRRPISKSDELGLELLFILYATNLSAVNIKEVDKVRDYYQYKYTGRRVNKIFAEIAKKHAASDAYKFSNLAWGHIEIKYSNKQEDLD